MVTVDLMYLVIPVWATEQNVCVSAYRNRSPRLGWFRCRHHRDTAPFWGVLGVFWANSALLLGALAASDGRVLDDARRALTRKTGEDADAIVGRSVQVVSSSRRTI